MTQLLTHRAKDRSAGGGAFGELSPAFDSSRHLSRAATRAPAAWVLALERNHTQCLRWGDNFAKGIELGINGDENHEVFLWRARVPSGQVLNAPASHGELRFIEITNPHRVVTKGRRESSGRRPGQGPIRTFG